MSMVGENWGRFVSRLFPPSESWKEVVEVGFFASSSWAAFSLFRFAISRVGRKEGGVESGVPPLPPFSLSSSEGRKGGRAAFTLQHCNYALSLSLSPPVAKEGSTGEGHTLTPLLKNKKGTTLEFEFHFNGEHSLSRSTVWENGVFLHPLDFQLSLSSWSPATDGRRWW